MSDVEDTNCPYCQRLLLSKENNSDQKRSRDHIFPNFLGGSATVQICKRCNNTFGHSFEANVSKTLAPLMVMLGHAGIKPKKPAVWKKAFINPKDGGEYDLNSDRVQYLRVRCSSMVKMES